MIARVLHPERGFVHRDPWQADRDRPGAGDGYPDSLSAYEYVMSRPTFWLDPMGLRSRGRGNRGDHCHPWTFGRIDQWVRMRLRSILRRRCGRQGRGRGRDHLRWPNAFFTAHGLFSLTAAHVAARRSSSR